MRVLLAVVTLTLLAPLTLGAEEASGPRLVPLHDVDPDGHTAVGQPTHFGFLVLGSDGTPHRHQDVAVTVVQNGVTLFDSASLHDYDGVIDLDVVFVVPGPYEVLGEAKVEGETVTASFSGVAVDQAATEVPATLSLDAPASVAVGESWSLTAAIEGPDGRILSHTDAIVLIERVRDRETVWKSHLHTHDDAMQARLALQEPGEYDVHVRSYIAFPRPTSTTFVPFVDTHRITVTEGAAHVPDAATAAPGSSRDATTAGESPGADWALFTTYDPEDRVGTDSLLRADLVVFNESAGEAVQHVNFEATVTDPLGHVLFESASLHEYDGVLELAGRYTVPGTYTADVTAFRGDWSKDATLTWTVVPAVQPLGGGVFDLTLSGADGVEAGTPVDLTITPTAEGATFQHGELNVEVVGPHGNVPLVEVKLHTHATPTWSLSVNFPADGLYALKVDPSPTLPAAALQLGGPLLVDVGPGPGLPAAAAPAGLDDGEAPMNLAPGVGLLGLLVVVTAAALRRQTV